MRVCLINPTNPLVNIVDVSESRWNYYRVCKPLSLMVLAGLTPPAWDIAVVDENLSAADYAAMPRPDLVGLTAFTSQSPRAYELAGYFRSRGVPVVMGGIHATMCVDEAMEHVDSVVTGEAESVWGNGLRDVEHGHLKHRYDGGQASLTDLSPARHDLLQARHAFGAIQTTRRCPLNCNFRSVTTFNGFQYRQRPISDVVREFQSIREPRVLLVDDNLIGTPRNPPGTASRPIPKKLATPWQTASPKPASGQATKSRPDLWRTRFACRAADFSGGAGGASGKITFRDTSPGCGCGQAARLQVRSASSAALFAGWRPRWFGGATKRV